MPKIMGQSEGMAQFVRYQSVANNARDQCFAAGNQCPAFLLVESPPGSPRLPAAAPPDCIYAVVDEDDVNVLLEVEPLTDLLEDDVGHVEVVIVGVLPIDAMHLRPALRIGFKTEGCVSVAVRFHLLGIEGLDLANSDFHRIDHFLTKRAVIRQEVDKAHRARFPDVQIRQRFGRRAGVIALPVLVVVECGEMHAVNRRGRGMGGGQGRKQGAGQSQYGAP